MITTNPNESPITSARADVLRAAQEVISLTGAEVTTADPESPSPVEGVTQDIPRLPYQQLQSEPAATIHVEQLPIHDGNPSSLSAGIADELEWLRSGNYAA